MRYLLFAGAAVATLTTPLAAQQDPLLDAPVLFWPAEVSPSLDLADDDPVVRRRGVLRTDLSMLHRLAPPEGEYSFTPISVAWIRLLFETQTVKVSIDARTETDYGLRLSGSLVGSDYGILVLVVRGGNIVTGQMRTARDVFHISTDPVGEFIVTQLDPAHFCARRSSTTRRLSAGRATPGFSR